MEPENLFANAVLVVMFGIIATVLLGKDPSFLIKITPEVVMVAFVAALSIAILQTFLE